jgi:hypothetical protein
MTFKLLYCFFAIEHGRRKSLHINTTLSSDCRVGGAAVA